MIFKSKSIFALFSVVLIILSALTFQNETNQGFNWTYPYFSGAANFEKIFDWQISPTDYGNAAKLSDQEYRKYKHNKTGNTIKSINNFYGYVLIALVSMTLFPMMGDLNGVILLQIIIHTGVSLFLILKLFETRLLQWGFLILYAANPLILHFVTFPIYFFWSCIPGLMFIVLWLKPDWRKILIPLFLPISLLALMIRPTTLFLCIYIFAIAIFLSKTRRERIIFLFWMVLFFIGSASIQSQSTRTPWHTMYIGLGAYSNVYGVNRLSDNEAYQLFYNKTGIAIDTNSVNGNYNDPTTRNQYDRVLRERYFQIVTEHPLSIIKNISLNAIRVFSIGYIVDRPWLNRGMLIFGVLVALFLVVTQQWVWIIGVVAASIGYVLYFPPIPAYHFGAYSLLVFGSLSGIQLLIDMKNGSKKIRLYH
jgi:hypothetical protein